MRAGTTQQQFVREYLARDRGDEAEPGLVAELEVLARAA